jgi:hypothetical protein
MKKAAAARGLNVSEPKPTDPDALRRWKNRQQTRKERKRKLGPRARLATPPGGSSSGGIHSPFAAGLHTGQHFGQYQPVYPVGMWTNTG